MTPTPSSQHRSTDPRTSTAPLPAPGSSRRRVRRAATGVLAGLAVTSAGSLLLHGVAGIGHSSAPEPTVSVAAQTASKPTPVAAPLERRASRSRLVPVPKKAPTKKVVRTVAVGPSFSGQASWYGGSFQGQRTANGERFDTGGYTAASKTLPFGTRLRVCHDGCVVVRVNDRGPYVGGRVLDLTRAASSAIGFSGVAHVTATPIDERTVTVVDKVALARLRASEAHAAKVARSEAYRAAAQAKADAARAKAVAPVTQARSSAPSGPVLPTRPAAATLASSMAGLVLLRRLAA